MRAINSSKLPIEPKCNAFNHQMYKDMNGFKFCPWCGKPLAEAQSAGGGKG